MAAAVALSLAETHASSHDTEQTSQQPLATVRLVRDACFYWGRVTDAMERLADCPYFVHLVCAPERQGPAVSVSTEHQNNDDVTPVWRITTTHVPGVLLEQVLPHLYLMERVLIMVSVARAVAVMRFRGVVHLDLRLGTIKWYGAGGHICVLDFDRAACWLPRSQVGFNTREAVDNADETLYDLGRPIDALHVPPEVRGGQFHKNSDLWSLGVMVLSLLTGVPAQHWGAALTDGPLRQSMLLESVPCPGAPHLLVPLRRWIGCLMADAPWERLLPDDLLMFANTLFSSLSPAHE